ncbi:MAG: ribosome small subunit-dependent GTPase A [Chitinivibrionales bacterium]
MKGLLSGKVIEEQKNGYIVDTGDSCYTSVLKGRIKQAHKRIYPGDNVEIEPISEESRESIIRSVGERRNTLEKPAVANLDQVLYVASFKRPVVSLSVTDRFLLNCKHRGIRCIIIFNKKDLLNDNERSRLKEISGVYEGLGYRVILSSAETKEGFGCIKEECTGGVNVFAGVSGVGKSCLMRHLFPGVEFKTSSLSRKLERGRHTTSHTSLLKYDHGTYFADTPGFSFVELPEITAKELGSCFPEISEYSSTCRFSDCTHTVEPGCSVREACDKGLITESRLKSYMMFYNEII